MSTGATSGLIIVGLVLIAIVVIIAGVSINQMKKGTTISKIESYSWWIIVLGVIAFILLIIAIWMVYKRHVPGEKLWA